MKKIISLLFLQFVLSLNLLSASSSVTIPEKVRIYYNYDAFSTRIFKEWYDDEKSVLEAYQHGISSKGIYIKNTILEGLRRIDDPSLSDQRKLWHVERCFSELASNHTTYGMVSISDNRMVELAEQLENFENNQAVCDPARVIKDIYFVVLLDYKERTDTLSMSDGSDQLFYKGKPYKTYKCRPVFYAILDMIRDLDPIWRKKTDEWIEWVENYDLLYKGKKENEKKEMEEIENIFNQIIGF